MSNRKRSSRVRKTIDAEIKDILFFMHNFFGNKVFEKDDFFKNGNVITEAELKRYWKTNRNDLITEYAAMYPGNRPFAFYFFDLNCENREDLFLQIATGLDHTGKEVAGSSPAAAPNFKIEYEMINWRQYAVCNKEK